MRFFNCTGRRRGNDRLCKGAAIAALFLLVGSRKRQEPIQPFHLPHAAYGPQGVLASRRAQ